MGAIVELDNALLTFGNVFWNCRRELGVSQREMAAKIARFGPIDYIVLSKIENDRLDINGSKWDWLIRASASIYETTNRNWQHRNMRHSLRNVDRPATNQR